jgi:hypothetical protein
MTKRVVAFVGENENEALAAGSHELLDAMKPLGFEGHLVNVNDPQWMTQLGRLVNSGVHFGFGLAGIGAALGHVDEAAKASRNLWEMLRVPFISILADQPSHQPRNHRVASRYVVNGYLFRDFFETQRRFIRSPQVSVMLPQICAPNPNRDKTPWGKRTHRMIFVKSGGDPAHLRAEWQKYPARLRAILEEASAEVLKRPTGDISDLVLDCFVSHGIEVGERHDIFFIAAQQVDLYVRRVRATQMAEALCRVPADIIGARWDHIERSGAKARFLPPVKSSALPALYADAQFIVNVTPNLSSGAHERVMQGMAAKACVISDDNDFTRRRFGTLRNYHGFDWTDPDWVEKIAAQFDDRTDYGDLVQPAVDLLEADFAPRKLVDALLEIAELVRFGENCAPLAYTSKS